MKPITKVAFLQYCCSKNINSNDIMMLYFNQTMWLYDIFDVGCELIDITTGEDSITYKVKYPYELESSPIGTVLRQYNSQIVRIYESFYLVTYLLESPSTVVITFKNVNQ